jgi:hypothetical protein
MQRLAPCSSLLLWGTFSFPAPSAVVLDYSLLFIVQFFFFLRGGCQSAQALCWFILGEFHVVHGAHLLGL